MPPVEPDETVLRCMVLTEAAEFTLELLEILRVLTPYAAHALELSCAPTANNPAWEAVRKAREILDESQDEEPES